MYSQPLLVHLEYIELKHVAVKLLNILIDMHTHTHARVRTHVHEQPQVKFFVNFYE